MYKYIIIFITVSYVNIGVSCNLPHPARAEGDMPALPAITNESFNSVNSATTQSGDTKAQQSLPLSRFPSSAAQTVELPSR